jgi:hypothetical protein
VVITSTVQNDHQWYGRDTVVAEFVELSARTGKIAMSHHTDEVSPQAWQGPPA